MKLTTFLLVGTTVAGQCNSAEPQTRAFVQVPLEQPLDWTAGCTLFPANVIAGYHANLNEYTATEWAQYVLGQCRSFLACTSSLTFSAINSGTPKERYWFGYVFRGGRTTQDNYTRSEGVQDSIAYTIT